MEASTFDCRKCATALPIESINNNALTPCPTCGTRSRVYVFPALFKPPEKPHTPDRIIVDKESSCFYHPEKKAVTPCDHCGRFLCSLCDIPIGDRHLCPACVEKGADSTTETPVENEYTYYDRIALSLAVLPILIWPFTLFTAPLTLYIIVRYWKKPLSVMPRRRWRYVLAALIAVPQVAAWGFLFVSLIGGLIRAATSG